jgi:hypothetical protein
MGGMLVATVSFSVIVAVVLVVLVALTVAPLFVALQMADARRFSTTRWAAVAAVTIVVGLGLAYVLHQHDRARVLVVLPLLLTWTSPAMLWLLEPGQTRIGGRAGLHE